MSKRNFILLIIILIITVLAFFGFLYFRKEAVPPEESGGTNFLSQFSPWGTGGQKPPATTPPTEIPPTEIPGTEEGLSLLKVSSMPVAGYGVFMKERYREIPPPNLTPALSQGEGDSTDSAPPSGGGVGERSNPVSPPTEFVPALRYAARADGNIYQTFADKIDERKFTGTVIPKVYEALFGNNGESVIMRYLKADGRTIETFVGSLPKEILGGDSTGENEVRGSFLPANITDISVSSDGKSAFYLFDTRENTIGTTYDFGSGKKVQVFDSVFNEWLSWWGSSKMITLSTKPSYLAPGYMYKLDPTNKNFAQVLSGITGLTTLGSPDGKKVLYADNTLSLKIYHTDTKFSDSLGVRTLPEKCIWGKGSDVIYCAAPKIVISANFPDVWYQGEVSFDDQIWKIDAETGIASIILDPGEVGARENVDGIKLQVDSGENYLFFVNKKDSFLWKLNLK